MVSLAPKPGQGQSGFAFASTSDKDSVRSEEVDLLIESDHVSPVINRLQFLPTRLSLIIAVFESLLLVLFEVMIFVLAQGLHVVQLGGKHAPLSFLALLHALLWLVVVVSHFILAYQHNQLRLYGYLAFYRKTKSLRHIPPLVLSFGNALVLGYMTVMKHLWSTTTIPAYIFVQIVYTLEFIIIFPTLIYYITKVLAFNKKRALPDAYVIGEDNVRLEAQGQIGYSEVGWPNGVLEKQGDMICYLQQHNENLSRRLLRLSSQAPNN